VNDQDWLAERFETSSPQLQAVAYRMLGSLNEADDTVQETWLRLSRSDLSGIESLSAWLMTVVLCLGRTELPVPHASGHAFTTVAMVLAGLALLSALLAALVARQERNATVPRVSDVLGRAGTATERA
jgi:hypothetical protein